MTAAAMAAAAAATPPTGHLERAGGAPRRRARPDGDVRQAAVAAKLDDAGDVARSRSDRGVGRPPTSRAFTVIAGRPGRARPMPTEPIAEVATPSPRSTPRARSPSTCRSRRSSRRSRRTRRRRPRPMADRIAARHRTDRRRGDVADRRHTAPRLGHVRARPPMVATTHRRHGAADASSRGCAPKMDKPAGERLVHDRAARGSPASPRASAATPSTSPAPSRAPDCSHARGRSRPDPTLEPALSRDQPGAHDRGGRRRPAR